MMLKRNSRIFNLVMGGLLIVLVVMVPAVFSDHAVSGDIIYSLTWEQGEAEAHTDGTWSVTNNLGYTVTVETGYVVSYSVELLACEHSHGFFQDLFSQWQPGFAYAGHGDLDYNPALLERTVVESLTAPTAIILGTVTVDEPAYCEGFYLAARARSHKDPIGLPDDVDMLETALFITGTYASQDSNTLTDFAISTSMGRGTVVSLTLPNMTMDGEVHGEIGHTPLQINIVRHLDSLFHTVDFDDSSDDEIAKQVLKNLAADTELVIVGGVGH